MGTGFLYISATMADGAYPVMAHVKITKDNITLLETYTDESGNTQPFPIPAPDAYLTLDSAYQDPAYSTVDVTVSAPGFITVHIEGVEIVDTMTSILPVDMKPAVNGMTDEYITIPPIGLFMEHGPYPPPPPETRVLNQVLIPEYITVHLGIPSNTSARNIRVRFIDYIKNVMYTNRLTASESPYL